MLCKPWHKKLLFHNSGILVSWTLYFSLAAPLTVKSWILWINFCLLRKFKKLGFYSSTNWSHLLAAAIEPSKKRKETTSNLQYKLFLNFDVNYFYANNWKKISRKWDFCQVIRTHTAIGKFSRPYSPTWPAKI